MILIADSGSTKTDWCIVFNGTSVKRMGTKGINPFFQSEEEIQQELTHSPSATTTGRNNQLRLFLWCWMHARKGSRPPAGYCRQPARHREYQSLLGHACRCPRTMRT